MSMKVYTGWKIDTGDVQEVYRLVEKIRPWAKRYAEKMIDDFCESERGNYGDWRERHAQVKKTGLRDPEVDTQFQIVIFPRRRVIYGMVFSENSHPFYDRWLKLPGVKNYSYWNNTDKPRNIPMKEWNARETFWRSINKPAMDGFTLDVLDPDGPMPKPWRKPLKLK